MENKDISYKDARDEMNIILEELESGDINVDELSKKVKRASELYTLCKAKLRKTDEEVQKILKEMDTNE
ncbi:MAG: exodeoxyribonuclease VII small subunit [Hyphomicrobiales bacterium]